MNLVIDLGNSNVKLAIFNGEEAVEHHRCPKNQAIDLIKDIIEKYPIKSSIISHTSPPSELLLKELDQLEYFIDFSWDTLLPIQMDYNTPKTLGRDRIAGAVACFKLFPNERCLFIDMGTCITKNVVSETGVFLGGNISPGIEMRLKSMHVFTARLPQVEPQLPENEIGKSTEEALQNGGIRGTIDEIEHFILREKERFDRINVILTGGNSDFFVNLSNIKIFVAPFLVLTGLNEILNYNANKK